MKAIVSQNSQGFSLIETLIAMLILFIILLALFMATALMLDSNFMNSIRNEAIRLNEMRMAEIVNTPFNLLTAHTWGRIDLSTGNWSNDCQTVTIRIRNVNDFPFTMCERINNLSDSTRQVIIATGWDYKGHKRSLVPTQRTFQHVISSTVSR